MHHGRERAPLPSTLINTNLRKSPHRRQVYNDAVSLIRLPTGSLSKTITPSSRIRGSMQSGKSISDCTVVRPHPIPYRTRTHVLATRRRRAGPSRGTARRLPDLQLLSNKRIMGMEQGTKPRSMVKRLLSQKGCEKHPNREGMQDFADQVIKWRFVTRSS